MKLKPLHDRLLLKPLAAETKTKAGIIIPDTAQEKPMQGEVVAVGKVGGDEPGPITPEPSSDLPSSHWVDRACRSRAVKSLPVQ